MSAEAEIIYEGLKLLPWALFISGVCYLLFNILKDVLKKGALFK